MKPFASKFGYSVAILLVAGYVVVTLRGPNGLSGLMAKRQRTEELEKSNLRRAKENEQLKERIRRLQENPDLVLQQKLKVVGPNDDKVYILPDSDKLAAPKK